MGATVGSTVDDDEGYSEGGRSNNIMVGLVDPVLPVLVVGPAVGKVLLAVPVELVVG